MNRSGRTRARAGPCPPILSRSARIPQVADRAYLLRHGLLLAFAGEQPWLYNRVTVILEVSHGCARGDSNPMERESLQK